MTPANLAARRGSARGRMKFRPAPTLRQFGDREHTLFKRFTFCLTTARIGGMGKRGVPLWRPPTPPGCLR